MKFLFLCFVFFLVPVNSFSQALKDDDYFGNIGNETMSRSQAEAVVLKYFTKKLKNTTRHAVLKPSKSNNIVSVDIVELDGSLFYHIDINRSEGRIIGDDRYMRQKKIQDNLKKKKQSINERKMLREKYLPHHDKK